MGGLFSRKSPPHTPPQKLLICFAICFMRRLILNKSFIVVSIAALLVVVVLASVYPVIDARVRKEVDSKEEYVGDIETTAKRWLNGHLGTFFRFKFLGNVNWLIIPLLIWFLVRRREKEETLEQWQKALLFVWLALTIFLGVKGYANTRYQLTLFPFNSALTLVLLWDLLKGREKIIKIVCFTFVGLLCLFNVYHYFPQYQKIWDSRVALSESHFPHRLIDYLNSNDDINDQSRVFVINQPVFYYHTQKKGVDYLSPHVVKAWIELSKKSGSTRRVHRLLKRFHKVGYVLLKSIHQRFYRSIVLEEFLHCECRLVMEDSGWVLYKLKNKPLSQEIKSPAHREINVWSRNKLAPGSNVKDFQEVSPSLFRLSRSGFYQFQLSEKPDKTKRKNKRNGRNEKSVEVRMARIKEGQKPRIQFGFEFNRRGLEEKIPHGKYINFIVRTSISPHLLNINNCIMVTDYVEAGKSWDQAKTVFSSPTWRTYIVSKKIRPGASRLIAMFRFTPQSTEDRLWIKDVKIVISEKPL
jgi:hypothetical protein